jgi:CDP-paratose 2-epimerase
MSVVTHINRVSRPRALGRIDQGSGCALDLGGDPRSAVSLREVISIIAELRGIAPDLRFAPWRSGDQPWYVYVIRAIGAALDWSPRVAFRDGLRELDRRLDACFAHSATPPAELQEAHA